MKSERVLPADVKSDLDRLTAEFFRVVSFRRGEKPPYSALHNLFVDNGLLIKNSLSTPEISNVSQFIEPRASLVNSGELTSFEEVEIAEITEIFGNVAHRFSTYEKSGTMKGVPFGGRGMISTQFVMTPFGWKISAMAWDDERPGSLSPIATRPPNAVCLDSMLRRWHAVRSAPVSFVRWAAGDHVT